MATLQEAIVIAKSHNLNYEKVVTRDDGRFEILFSWEPNDSYLWWGGTGFLQSEQQCIDFAYDLFSTIETEELMKLLKNDKLFPHIRGVMLKDKRVTLHLSGEVNITELQGGDARAELHFSDHAKTAVINRNQLLKIIEVYGDDTDDMKNVPITLYGEHGKWFGKEQWGIRVDIDETKKQAGKSGYIYDKKNQIWTKPKTKQSIKSELDIPTVIGMDEFNDIAFDERHQPSYQDAEPIDGEIVDESPSMYAVGDGIILHGKNDEKAGTVVDVNGDKVTVMVDGTEYTVNQTKLTKVTA